MREGVIEIANYRPQTDTFKKPGRKKKRRLTEKQDTYVNTLIETGSKSKALEAAGYSPTSNPENYAPIQNALAERQKEMMKRFMDNAEEMKENMLDLARNATSESVRFQATKDMLDRAGLNPINKNQTESAKYVSIESRFSREALARFEKEINIKAEEAGE